MNRLITTLIATLLLSACQKDKNESQSLIDSELKAFYDFEPGSYWILKDSASGALDSLVVANKYSSFRNSSGVIYESVLLDMRTHSLSTSNINSFWYIELRDMTTAGLMIRNFDQQTTGRVSLLVSPPSRPGLASYSQDGTTYRDVYVSGATAKDSSSTRVLMNAETGFIRLNLAFEQYRRNFSVLRHRIIH